MQVPVSNTANAFTILSGSAVAPGIEIKGLVPGGSASALFLGDRATGGWERFIRFSDGLAKGSYERLAVRGGEKPSLSRFLDKENKDVIVLVRTGSGVKNTKIAQHGVYVPHGSDAKQVDAGTIKRGGTVTSREELWLLPEGTSIIVLTATGRSVHLTNNAGKAYVCAVDREELKELSTERVLDIVEQTIDKGVDKGLHWLIGHASEYPESFSQKSRERFRAIVTKYRDKASEGVHRRLEGLYKRFYDGRFGGHNDNVVAIGKKKPVQKGPSAQDKAKRAERIERDRERTFDTKGPSPQPPQKHKKSKVKA